MGDEIKELTEKNFNSSIKKGKWIVDFWAEWCGPCKIMAPHFDSAAKELKGKVNFAKLNVDDNYEIANKFHVMSIPTIMLFEDGEVVHASVGALNKEQILSMIKEMF